MWRTVFPSQKRRRQAGDGLAQPRFPEARGVRAAIPSNVLSGPEADMGATKARTVGHGLQKTRPNDETRMTIEVRIPNESGLSLLELSSLSEVSSWLNIGFSVRLA
jgi:hypothetical protein